jgi:hypothetical protein
MERQLKAGYRAPDHNGIRLQQLVDGLVGNSLPIARKKGTAVVNEVGRGVVLRSVTDQLVDLMDEILATVIANSRGGDIHIRAQRQVILSITERSNYNGYALASRVGGLSHYAAAIGCSLEITTPQELVTTICFSFPERIAA